MMALDDEMHVVMLFKALCVVEQESNNDVEVSNQNMVDFETKLPKDITAKNIKIHCVPDD